MLGKTRFVRLSEPGQIGRVKTKNRTVKAAAGTFVAAEDGYVSDTNLAHYETLAKGGVGLIVIEFTAIDYPAGYPAEGFLRIDDDKFIPRLSELASAIHRHSVPAFVQLSHCGPAHEPILDTQPRASSSLSLEQLPTKKYGPTIGLTIPEIEDIIDKFADAAERAQGAGFDGVEVHGASAYLINSFLSGAWNQRKDRYGGSLENRARLACQVLRAIKERVSKDYPVGIRVNGAEYGIENGLVLKEAQAICPLLQESGADYISVTAYGFGPIYNRVNQPEQIFYPVAPRPLEEGLDRSRKGAAGLTLLSAGVKKVVTVPVITAGRLDPLLGEWVLRKGRADFVAFARCLMADPEIVRKALEGRLEDIRPCMGCARCADVVNGRRVAKCQVNATQLKEGEYKISPADKKKRVMVIGGGPAGMEAARVSVLRGHEVSLYEKEHRLGGLMLLAALVKGLEVEDLVQLIRYFSTQMKKLSVKVTPGKEVDEALIKETKPDVVILATGGLPSIPEIPGINKPIVVSQERFYRMVKPYMRFFGPKLLRWLTNLYLPIGKRVVIIGGGMQGLELAEFMVKRRRKVTVTETSEELGAGLVYLTKERLVSWLAEVGCTLLSSVTYEEITDRGLNILSKEGKKQTIEADSILIAQPLKPNKELSKSLKGKVPELYLIGDASEPSRILEAIHEGFRTALRI